jgi:hypothetical protein
MVPVPQVHVIGCLLVLVVLVVVGVLVCWCLLVCWFVVVAEWQIQICHSSQMCSYKIIYNEFGSAGAFTQ